MDEETIIDKDGEEALYVEPKEGETDEQAEAPEVEEKTIEETTEVTTQEAVVEEKPILTKIGDREYTPEELQEIVTKGSKVKEWETKMPGFDVDKLMPDYTRKSQELARLTKNKPAEKKETLEELGIDEAQIKLLERAVKHLGYVKQSDLVENSVEAQKDIFISRHPEYTPGTPEADAKWSSLMSEFSLYNWQAFPNRVEELLEKTHKEISKSSDETTRGAKVLNNVATKTAQAAASAMGGGAGRSVTPVIKTQPSDEIALYKKAGWSDEQIKEFLS